MVVAAVKPEALAGVKWVCRDGERRDFFGCNLQRPETGALLERGEMAFAACPRCFIWISGCVNARGLRRRKILFAYYIFRVINNARSMRTCENNKSTSSRPAAQGKTARSLCAVSSRAHGVSRAATGVWQRLGGHFERIAAGG